MACRAYARRMREPLDQSRLLSVLKAIGRAAGGPGRIYLTGGATALLFGWRASTIDVDLRLDPEPPRVFEAIADVKQRLNANIELASPADFLPELPGWRDRSLFVDRFGKVDFFHYDPYAQALAKIERGHVRDVADVAQLHARGLIEPELLLDLFARIEPMLIRFPALDPPSFRSAVELAVGTMREAQS